MYNTIFFIIAVLFMIVAIVNQDWLSIIPVLIIIWLTINAKEDKQ